MQCDLEQMTDAELDKYGDKVESVAKAAKNETPPVQSEALTAIDWVALALELLRRWRNRANA